MKTFTIDSEYKISARSLGLAPNRTRGTRCWAVQQHR